MFLDVFAAHPKEKAVNMWMLDKYCKTGFILKHSWRNYPRPCGSVNKQRRVFFNSNVFPLLNQKSYLSER